MNGIVEGSVERTGQQVRVNIKLIDVAAEGNLLADVYEGSLDNIPVLENEVAAALIHRIWNIANARRRHSNYRVRGVWTQRRTNRI